MILQEANYPTVEIVLVIVNVVILPLMGWVVGKINHICRETKDLWEWHKPDGSGRQAWKNPEIEVGMNALTEEIRGLREDLRNFMHDRAS